MGFTMKNSLEERYITRRLRLTEARVARAEAQVLRENKAATLIIEALDQSDYQRVTQIIDKLRKLKGHNMTNLDNGIDQAIAQLNKYSEGKPLDKVWRKLKGVFGFDNPVVKILTFADALEKGFGQMPTIIKNNLGDSIDKSKSIAQLVINEKTRKTLVGVIRKALSPGGLFGAFKKVPYVGADALTSDILTTPINNLINVIKVVESGVQTKDIAPDMKQQLQPGGTQTAATKVAEPGQQTKQTSKTEPGKEPVGTTTTRNTEEQGPGNQKQTNKQNGKKVVANIIQNHGRDIAQIISKENDPTQAALKIMVYLEKIGALELPKNQ